MKLTKLQVKAAVNKLKREFKNMQNEDREKLAWMMQSWANII